MGEFFEPQESEAPKPKVFTKEFLTKVVDESIKTGEVGKEDRLVFVAATDENGIKFILGIKRNPFGGNLDVNFVAEHEWDGDNRIGAKVIFSHR